MFNFALLIFYMAGNSFLRLFLPKDRVFYQLFENVAKNLIIMGDKMHQMVNESNKATRLRILKELEDLEHANDDYTHEIFTQLGKNFITPIDREDIHALATALDDIADYIYAASKKINFYHINPNNDEGILKMADIIKQGCREVNQAVSELRNMKHMKKITDALVLINSIENQGDDVFDESIARLFEEEDDAKEVIKRRDIYQVMELVTDKFEDAGNVIESILVKYA